MKERLSVVGIALIALGVAILALVFLLQPMWGNAAMLTALAIELAGVVCWFVALKRQSKY